jgi:hypothetical protein
LSFHGITLTLCVPSCERQGKWLDEAAYAIDTNMLPRGGARRRKSMEPKAVSALAGQLVPCSTPGGATSLAAGTAPAAAAAAGAATVVASSANTAGETSPTKEFLTFSSPARRESTLFVKVASPSTPTSGCAGDDTVSEAGTPYFLHPAELVQRTCPPKRNVVLKDGEDVGPRKTLFPVTGRIEDQQDEGLRMRLELARRRSLQWRPKVGSPLGVVRRES